MEIRNIAIIAHVDHGKTTLVDHLLKQSGTFRENEQVDDRFMDSMDLERERGITIAAKNASIIYQNYKINIVDTPGHSDFGGEVERILTMVDGCVLLVDASEGPLPQTRFVLSKALDQDKKIIVCINKIDRPDARIEEVMNEIYDLFFDLDATEEQLDFKVVYAIAKDGMATHDPEVKTENLQPLYELIVGQVPAPKISDHDGLQMVVANISYNDYVGRLAIGRVYSGSIKVGDEILRIGAEDKRQKVKVSLSQYKSSQQVPAQEILAGDVAIVAGIEDFEIGDTLTSPLNPKALPRLKVEEPTVGMNFSVNDSPFAGREGKMVTSRQILERLKRELLFNVAIRLDMTEATDTWKIVGRGELQLAVLIEQMRREGFELLVSKPQVVFRKEEGKVLEPMEKVVIDVEEAYVGAVTEKLGKRKGILTNMMNFSEGRSRIEFRILPSDWLSIKFLTDTRGTGLLNTQYDGYDEFKGEIVSRNTGVMISDRAGKTTQYSLNNLEDRGKLLVSPGAEVYEGMVVGEHAKSNDLVVNAVQKLTNVRASGTDEAVRLAPVPKMTLERAIEFISDHELIEVTPENIRIRCRELDPHKRKKK